MRRSLTSEEYQEYKLSQSAQLKGEGLIIKTVKDCNITLWFPKGTNGVLKLIPLDSPWEITGEQANCDTVGASIWSPE